MPGDVREETVECERHRRMPAREGEVSFWVCLKVDGRPCAMHNLLEQEHRDDTSRNAYDDAREIGQTPAYRKEERRTHGKPADGYRAAKFSYPNKYLYRTLITQGKERIEYLHIE